MKEHKLDKYLSKTRSLTSAQEVTYVELEDLIQLKPVLLKGDVKCRRICAIQMKTICLLPLRLIGMFRMAIEVVHCRYKRPD